ncbi:unnamed protein product [Soboliphyme baturini]|uniref:Signal recognition particle subunit SRP68 n=1 Tax=Soboliphyme baturini TaxID=241478 RepID=A0A183J097_9BILA|nr:unnamed protein product [Soboliphyme baturini]
MTQLKKPPALEDIADSRCVQMFVFEAERCWAYAMQLKQEVGNDTRKRFHLNRKLKKFECQHWPQAIESFTTLKTIYEKLSAVTESAKMSNLYQQRCQEVVPQLRYCAFNIGDESALSELMEMRMKIIEEQENPLLSDLDRLLTECRQKQSVVEMETVWCRRKIVLEKPPQTKSFCIILQQFPEQVSSTLSIPAKNLNIRSLADEGEENFTNTQLVYLYLVYLRLTKTIELYWLMVQDMKQKGSKAQDLVRLCDSVLQTFSELQSLPLLAEDSSLVAQVNHQILYVKAYR